MKSWLRPKKSMSFKTSTTPVPARRTFSSRITRHRFRGAPLYVVVLVAFNAEGKAHRLVVNHRPRSSVLLLSRVMLERFAGTPLAKHWEGTP
jgi:hypothetical protein